MKKDRYYPVCGDVGFVGHEFGASLLADGIGNITTSYKETPTKAHHQFQVIYTSAVVEALGRANIRRVISRQMGEVEAEIDADPKAHCIIFRPPVNELQKVTIDKIARRLIGYRYGYAEVALHVVDGLLRKVRLLRDRRPLFTRLGAIIPWTVICSGVGNHCLSAVGVLPRRFRYLDPDATFDEAVERGWRIVAMSKSSSDYWGLSFRDQA